MLEKEIQKNIERKINAMEEAMKYHLDSLCELLSDIKTIRYMMFLCNDKNSDNI